MTPLSIPSVIARKHKPPVPPATFVRGISRPRKDRERGCVSTVNLPGDEYAVNPASDDPFDSKVAAIQVSLRDRMRFYKLKVTTNAPALASQFNEQFQPERIPESSDPARVEWINKLDDEIAVGEKALRLADPTEMGYVLRWPFHGGNFNTRDYPSNEILLTDVEDLIKTTLHERLNIPPNTLTQYSVVLVIPDFYDRFYVQAMVRTLLVTMGFKQLCVQQESLAATYGAGISNGCVVDMGAATTSIACVDDGLVIPDTRMTLNMGGDAITEFLYVLLQKINFPHREMDLVRSYYWNVAEDLKHRLCTLAEGDVALNLYDFIVRRPGQPTLKYGLRAYDEVILAPMCLFEPRVIEFEARRSGLRPFSHPDVTDEVLDRVQDGVTSSGATQAMMISTQHLLPSALPTPGVPQDTPSVVPPVEPGTVDTGEEAAGTGGEGTQGEDVKSDQGSSKVSAVNGDGTADAPMEIDDDGEAEAKPTAAAELTQAAMHLQHQQQLAASHPVGYGIDVCFEASKLPLDVAIFNSARAAGGDEKIRKYLQAVLVVGGTALVPGMAHALESRLQAIATPLVPSMEKVQIIPPPKDVDPWFLAWKGGAVLGKMDSVADLWITAADWDIFGMRGLKERCFFI